MEQKVKYIKRTFNGKVIIEMQFTFISYLGREIGTESVFTFE